MVESMGGAAQHDSERCEEFLRLCTRDDFRVLAFIRSMIYDRDAAQDVFQETSLALWRNFASYRREADFIPWALGVARNQVLKYYPTSSRDRHVFNETLLAELAAEVAGRTKEMERRQVAIEQCVERLPQRQQALLRMFYGDGQSAAAIAKHWQRSVHAVYFAVPLFKSRRDLTTCFKSKFSSRGSSRLDRGIC